MDRKIITMILSVFLVLSVFVVPISAAGIKDNAVSPAYEIGRNPVSELLISGTTAYCSGSVNGQNCVKITAEQTLEKYWGLWVWTTVDGANWTKTLNSNSIIISNTQSGLTSGAYRLKTVFTLTNNNGKSKTITVYSDEKTVV